MRNKFNDVRVAQVAGSLTYTSLLSLVPLLTVVLTVMSQFSQFAQLGGSLRAFLLDNLLPDRAGKVIATYAVQFSQKASNLTIVGTTVLFITAVMLLQTVERTFNNIWGIRRPRAWWVRIPNHWLALTLGPLLLAVSVVATGYLIKASLGVVDEPMWVRTFVYRLSPALMLSIFFGYLFHTVPNRHLVLWHSIVGGLVAGCGVVAIQRLFGFYLSKLPNVTLIYGTFSVVPIFLIWLYFSWTAILLGAIVAAVLPDFYARRGLLPDTPAGHIHSALRIMIALIESQQQGKALSLMNIARRSGQLQAHAERMLEDMLQAGWVARTENDEWMLSIAAGALKLGDVIAQLVIGSLPESTRAQHARNADQRVVEAAFARVRATLDTPIIDLIGNQPSGKNQVG
ncbi:MAG TPA: YihY family inner membrane protein [Rhodocyclaceae bacterium]|nr:YihY family inner membrane protein [Rhodocyclaceae bacterium]